MLFVTLSGMMLTLDHQSVSIFSEPMSSKKKTTALVPTRIHQPWFIVFFSSPTSHDSAPRRRAAFLDDRDAMARHPAFGGALAWTLGPWECGGGGSLDPGILPKRPFGD